jgi:hypothetical protein
VASFLFLLSFLALFPQASMAQTADAEVRSAVAELVQSPTRQYVAASQVIEGLVHKYVRNIVADAAIEPLTAALRGSNYQTRDNAASRHVVRFTERRWP